jgi:ribonuclease D
VITNAKQLGAFLPRLHQAEWVALDTEADSLHAYPEKLCLLQLSLPRMDVLIDPLAAYDLRPLLDELRDRELILHGGDYDLRLLRRDLNFVPTAVFDTMLAARFLGHTEFGLTSLVAKYLGVTLEKGSQTANWAQRPLSPRLATYARNDTHYLHPLAERLRDELRQKGRIDWHRQACAHLIADCSQLRLRDPNLIWRVGGSERLSRPALAVLRSLWHWREHEARQHDKPPYFILSHEALVALAAAAAQGSSFEALLPAYLTARRRQGVAGAIAQGLAVPPKEQPLRVHVSGHRFTDEENRLFSALKQQRDQRALELGMDPTFIASRATLATLAQSGQWNGLMDWQRALLSPGEKSLG